jgi:tetratricopeptide (TPR) repeat protein
VLILELALRLFSYGDNLHLFVNHPDVEYKGYRIVNPDIGKKYFQQFEYTAPPKDIFLKDKPDNCFRIFVMGSSSVVGFPYDNNIMFPRILHEWLREAYPDKKIEVVNTAITAINSFTLLDFMPQILKQEPDAILFYAGHNEFYGAFGAGSNEAVTHNPTLIRMHLKLMNSRVYQLTRNVISGVVGVFSKRDTATVKRGTLMSRIVKDADIAFGSKTYNEGIDNYRENLKMMLAMAEQKKVPFFLSDMVSNINDLKPFKSKESGNYRSAITHFNDAQRYEAEGNFTAAKENYTKARDYDCIRFRASSDINSSIVDFSKKYNNVHFVPTLSLFEANSPNGLVGKELLTEHVHPNIAGYFLLAESFFTSLKNSNLVSNVFNEYAPTSASMFMRGYGFTQLDYLIGKHRVTNLSWHWPFRDETAEYIDYRKVYRPVSHIDSLVFRVMVDSDLALADARMELAKEYENNNLYDKALSEYKALVMTNPYWPQYSRKVADLLLSMGDLPGAIRYFQRSLEQGTPSFYAHFRLGELFTIKNDMVSAILHFENALVLADKEKLSVLTKLYMAYTYQNDNPNTNRILIEIQKIKPGFTPQVPPRAYAYMDHIPIHVKDYLVRTGDLLKNGKIEEAEVILLESLKIKDTHIAHRRLGEIFFKRKEMQRAYYELKMVYNDFNCDTKFLHMYALVCLTLDKKQEMKSCIEKIKAVDPGYSGLEKLVAYIQ